MLHTTKAAASITMSQKDIKHYRLNNYTPPRDYGDEKTQ